jgi:hypothetical protein
LWEDNGEIMDTEDGSPGNAGIFLGLIGIRLIF